VWIDEAERRIWFLFETSRRGDETQLAKRLGGKADAAIFAKARES
jgi:hypothetical protein